MGNKKESFFWTSYSDLMTSLFFVMLVLFILVIVLLHRRMEATEKQLEAIQEVQQSTEDLSTDYFQYREDYKKYVLKIEVKYPKNEYDLKKIEDHDKDFKLQQLSDAGREIQSFMEKHNQHQYLLIVEGQASNDNYSDNYVLSYRRALGLIRFWIDESDIKFGENCEIVISGSGDGKLDTHSMRETTDESKNQRFLIYIIPKNILENESNN